MTTTPKPIPPHTATHTPAPSTTAAPAESVPTPTPTPTDAFAHPALFYRGEREYLDGTVPFIREGLANGWPVAVAVPGPTLPLLKDALADVLAADARAVHFVDMTTAGRNPGRIIPAVLRAFADAHRETRVRIIGEPIWPGRSSLEYPACVQHEALINSAFRGRDAEILCPYDADRLDEQILTDAYATHPVLVSGGLSRPSPTYAPEQVVEDYNLPLPPAQVTVTAYPFGVDDLPTVRHAMTEEAARLGLSGMRLQDLALTVAELTTNSVVHGGGTGTARIWAEASQLVCEVHDQGRLTDPLAGRHPASRDQPGGRGLLLVHRLTDLVRVHTGPTGTTIRCYLGNNNH